MAGEPLHFPTFALPVRHIPATHGRHMVFFKMEKGSVMTRIFIALAAIIATTAPLMAVERMTPPPVEAVQPTPITVGLDHPILLKRMTVTATALPDGAP